MGAASPSPDSAPSPTAPPPTRASVAEQTAPPATTLPAVHLPRARRWPHAMGGFVIGWLTGVVTLLVLSGLAVHLATLNGPATGDSDIRLQINIRYLNSAVQNRLQQQPQVIVGSVKTTGLTLGLAPQAGLVMTPTFDVAGLFQVSPTTDNQLSVQNGKLAMNMVGDPRLGDLPVPISLLPFDLAGQVRQAVDQITNNVLMAELNDDLRAGFGSDTFDITEVQTDGDYLALKLRRR